MEKGRKGEEALLVLKTEEGATSQRMQAYGSYKR